MPDPANVFDGEGTPPVTTPTTTPPIDGSATPPSNNLQDLLKNIKNEKGEQKYKSLEDALTALDHSQKYIPELKSQLSGTMEELSKVKEQMTKFENIEDTVQRLLAQQQPPKQENLPNSAGLDEQAVIKLVQDSLQHNKQAEVMDANQRAVNDALVSEFGDKAIETLDSKAKELGTTRQALGELAKTSPKLVLALFHGNQSKTIKPTLPSRGAPAPNLGPSDNRPTKSMLSGVSAREQAAHLNQIRSGIYAKHGIDN